MIHNDNSFESSKAKNIKNYNIFKKRATINTVSDVMTTAQPIRDENYPHLPSKQITDKVHKITKVTASVSSKRYAVTPRALS
jgi:hypothetical protein